ncbi:MAG: hypothetical protein JJE50_01575 [Actinomycetales bacterium]|nr:hypothetical protein [Actinomycetales bacterium]
MSTFPPPTDEEPRPHANTAAEVALAGACLTRHEAWDVGWYFGLAAS